MVANLVPVAIIDPFEMIQVQCQEGQGLTVTVRTVDLFLQDLLGAPAVGQAGELVFMGHAFQPALELARFGDVTREPDKPAKAAILPEDRNLVGFINPGVAVRIREPFLIGLGLARSQYPLIQSSATVGGFRGQKVLVPGPDHGLRVVAVEGGGLLVEVDVAPLRVLEVDAGRRVVQNGFEQGLFFTECLLKADLVRDVRADTGQAPDRPLLVEQGAFDAPEVALLTGGSDDIAFLTLDGLPPAQYLFIDLLKVTGRLERKEEGVVLADNLLIGHPEKALDLMVDERVTPLEILHENERGCVVHSGAQVIQLLLEILVVEWRRGVHAANSIVRPKINSRLLEVPG